jgi:sulfur-oxidizing protein SoxX
MKTKLLMGGLFALASTVVFAGSAEDELLARLKADFHTKGIAKVERLDQDAVQATCTFHHPDDLPRPLVRFLEQQELATVHYPADGKYLGDWKKGEKLAQDGKGNTWSDKPETPAGGNCYNCHQISPHEMSFGTIGPSLYHYGKNRGNTADVQQYTYTKIYDSKSYNLCTAMPRFGHVGALSEEQIKDLVALLLDPESPVNK